MDIHEEKKIIRKEYREKIKRYKESDMRERTERILCFIKASSFYTDKIIVALYAGTHNEVSLHDLFLDAQNDKKTSVFPKYQGKNSLRFYQVFHEKDLEIGAFGILEPREGSQDVPTNSIDVFFVPGVCFDSWGNRLGSGLGCYDEALKEAKSDAIFIGVAFSFQIAEEKLPTRREDIPMHYVITENAIIEARIKAKHIY